MANWIVISASCVEVIEERKNSRGGSVESLEHINNFRRLLKVGIL